MWHVAPGTEGVVAVMAEYVTLPDPEPPDPVLELTWALIAAATEAQKHIALPPKRLDLERPRAALEQRLRENAT